MKLRLLHLDGSLKEQAPFWDEADDPEVVDLSREGPAFRLWACERRMRAFAAALPEAGDDEPRATFFGSGDFHHLCAALVARLAYRLAEPLTVLHFDNHPDWVRLPPRYHCGSMVNRLLEMPHVKRVITLGPCSADLDNPGLKGGNLRALSEGRLEIYPWRHAPSRTWGRLRSGPGHRWEAGLLYWRNLGEGDFDAFLDELAGRLEGQAVYLTLDKDVLPAGTALTNWDQGEMPLSALLAAVRRIGRAARVVGADVCGDYSPPVFSSNAKRISAYFDQPGGGHPRERRAAVNAAVNRAIWTELRGIA